MSQLSRETMGKIMEKAVPIDKTGDDRIDELLGQLKDERTRRSTAMEAKAKRNARDH